MKCTRKKHLVIQNRRPQGDDNDAADDDDSTSLSFSEEGEITATWRELVGAFLIQLTVSSIGYSYGTIFAFSGEGGRYSDNKSFLISSVYITCWAFAEPWCRKSLSSNQTYTRIPTAIGLITAVGGIACNCTVKNIFLQVLGYGVVTGLGTSLVLAQTEELLKCHYPARHGLVQTFNNVGRALGSSSMPLASCALLAFYGYKGGSILIAGIMMQGLIGIVLLFPANILRSSLKARCKRQPRAYTLINNQDLWSKNSHSSPMSQTRDWRNPCRDDLHSSSREDSGFNGKIESFKSPTSRRKQPPIIEVMPKILEENEEVDEQHDEQIRLKQMTCVVHIENQAICNEETDQIEPSTQKSDKEDFSSNHENHNLQSIFNCVELMTPPHSEQTFEERSYTEDLGENYIFTDEEDIPSREQQFDSNHFEDILLETSQSSTPATRDSSSDVKFVNRKQKFNKMLSVKTTALDSTFPHYQQPLISKWCCCSDNQPHKNQTNSTYCMYKKSSKKPFDSFGNALKTPYFWPVLFLMSSLKLCPILFATLIPPLSLTRVPNCSLEAATFGVSVAGFSWLCLLVLTPWFNSIAPIKRRYVSSAGCFVAAIGLYLLSGADSRDSVTLGCAVFGIGHGIAISTASTLIDETLGSWNLANVATTLGTLSGSLILLSTILLYLILPTPDGLRFCFITLAVVQAVPAVAWLSQPIIKQINIYLCN